MNRDDVRLPVLSSADSVGAFELEIQRAISGDARFGRHDRMLYATDASIYQMEPLGVVIPSGVEDAQRAIRACGNGRVPMLPRGGGTSLAGQGVARALVIDLSASCNKLLAVDLVSMQASVEPGLTVDDLNDRLRENGLFFAPDPSTARQANIGGCIGNNAAGAHSLLYGRTSESVLGVDACLWDGTRVMLDEGAGARDDTARRLTEGVVEIVQRHEDLIRERFPKTLRRSAGYQLDVILKQLDEHGPDLEKLNLAPLLCGSEGTLAFTLGATLQLNPLPAARGLAVLAFDSVEAAIDSVVPILRHNPSAVELLDDLIMGLAKENHECRPYVDLLPSVDGGSPEAVLYVEFFSVTGGDEIREKLDGLREAFPAGAMQCHTDSKSMENAWKLRKAGEPLLHAIPGKRKPLGFVEDNAVPPERLGEFVRRFRKLVEDEGTIASFYAHASVGVLHVRPLLDLRDEGDEARMHRIAIGAARLAKELGGVMSGEHGDGRARGPLLEDYFGPELMGAFREVKALFDPHGLLNPGNIIDPGPVESISEHTRVEPDGVPLPEPEVATAFAFADQGGLLHAAEMCNGAGVCRKKSGGTMCPSYMASLDERHATRGRGNALRLAMTGQALAPGRGDSDFCDLETQHTLRLCLSCKACKSECPSNVDVARLKAEYTWQGYQQSKSIPLQARAFASVHRLNRMATIAPGLANSLNLFAPTRWLINTVLGIHAHRSLPKFNRPVKAASYPGLHDSPTVVVLSDSFSTHNDSSVVEATVRVLGAFGYAVEVVPVSDLGRAAISNGVLNQAIRDAQRTLDQIRCWIEDPEVVGFVVPEPSCLSSIADDWLDLKIDRPMELRRSLADRSALPEAFLAKRWGDHPSRPSFGLPPGDLVIHGHCHQKALWGIESSSAIFDRIAPGRVRVLETGCCGMAGSFGYTRDRFDFSNQIGELALFPAVRELADKDWLLMPGTSCRHQVSDALGISGIHPIEAVDRLLETNSSR